MPNDRVGNSCPDEGTLNTSILDEAPEEVPAALKEELLSYIDSKLESIVQEVREQIENESTPQPPLWSKSQVADFLNVSERTVENEVAAGKLTQIKVRGQCRYEEEHVMKYVRENVE